MTRGPVLLLPPSGVPSAVRAEIERLSPGKIIALGGTGALSAEQLDQVAAGRPTDRLSGKNRYQTAIAIASHQFGKYPGSVYLANGTVVADAIAGGALTDGPILLVSQDYCEHDTPEPLQDYLRATQPGRVVALGGTGSVCEQNLRAAAIWARGLHFVTESLPDATVGQPYEAVIEVETNWAYRPIMTLHSALPAGLSWLPETPERIVISGTPEEAGTVPLDVLAHESWWRITEKTYVLTVHP